MSDKKTRILDIWRQRNSRPDFFSTYENGSISDRSFIFQKACLAAIIFVFTILFLSRIDVSRDLQPSRIGAAWPNLVWQVTLIVGMIFIARQVTVFFTASLNGRWAVWMVLIAFVAYGICAYFFIGNRDVRDYQSFMQRDVWWSLPMALAAPATRIYAIIANRNVSPILAKVNIFLTIAALCGSGEIVFGAILAYDTQVVGHSFDISHNHLHSLIVSLEIIFFLGGFLGYWLAYRYNGKIKHWARNVSVALCVLIPSYVGFVVWMATLSFEGVDGFFAVFVGVTLVIVCPAITSTFLVRSRLRNSKMFFAILTFALLLLWTAVFVYVIFFRLDRIVFNVIPMASIGSAFILFAMAFVDTKMGRWETLFFTLLITSLVGSASLFFIFNKFNLASIIADNPFVNPEIFSLVLFMGPTGLFFFAVILRIVIASLAMHHSVVKEQRLVARAARALAHKPAKEANVSYMVVDHHPLTEEVHNG